VAEKEERNKNDAKDDCFGGPVHLGLLQVVSIIHVL
jgi:hypothetical protein